MATSSSSATLKCGSAPSGPVCPRSLRLPNSRELRVHVRSLTQEQQPTLSPHPDAVRRRTEAEERKRERETALAKDRAANAAGLKWWQRDLPVNVGVAECVADIKQAIAASSRGLVVMNFFGEECYSCKSLQPKLKQIAMDNPDVLFVKVNAGSDVLYDFCVGLGLSKVPYFMLFKDGDRVSAFSANLSPEKLALLRAEIAAHKTLNLGASDTAVYTACEA